MLQPNLDTLEIKLTCGKKSITIGQAYISYTHTHARTHYVPLTYCKKNIEKERTQTNYRAKNEINLKFCPHSNATFPLSLAWALWSVWKSIHVCWKLKIAMQFCGCALVWMKVFFIRLYHKFFSPLVKSTTTSLIHRFSIVQFDGAQEHYDTRESLDTVQKAVKLLICLLCLETFGSYFQFAKGNKINENAVQRVYLKFSKVCHT